jgi:hypothetical protein
MNAAMAAAAAAAVNNHHMGNGASIMAAVAAAQQQQATGGQAYQAKGEQTGTAPPPAPPPPTEESTARGSDANIPPSPNTKPLMASSMAVAGQYMQRQGGGKAGTVFVFEQDLGSKMILDGTIAGVEASIRVFHYHASRVVTFLPAAP